MIRLIGSEDKVKAIRQLVRVFCIYEFEDVSDKELDLLCEIIYAKGDIHEKAKKNFILNYKVSKSNFGQIVYRLGKKNILVPQTNRNGKQLHPSFQLLLDFVESPKKFKEHTLLKWQVID
jgi:hypothetical protein